MFPSLSRRLSDLIEDEEGNITAQKMLMIGTLVIVLGNLLNTDVLATHRSHSSHRSHTSHSSHSSGLIMQVTLHTLPIPPIPLRRMLHLIILMHQISILRHHTIIIPIIRTIRVILHIQMFQATLILFILLKEMLLIKLKCCDNPKFKLTGYGRWRISQFQSSGF